jgi:hypothetical protein
MLIEAATEAFMEIATKKHVRMHVLWRDRPRRD